MPSIRIFEKKIRFSWVFASIAATLFLLGLIENWLDLGIEIGVLSVTHNSGLVILSVLMIIPYYISKK